MSKTTCRWLDQLRNHLLTLADPAYPALLRTGQLANSAVPAMATPGHPRPSTAWHRRQHTEQRRTTMHAFAAHPSRLANW